MTKSIQLSLMIGPAEPFPVSKDVLDALESVQVNSLTDGPSGFQLTFTVSNRSALQTLFLVSGGADIPLMRVVVAVTVNGNTDVLIDGVMTRHQFTPGTGGTSILTITGEDLTKVMDYLDLSGIPYPCMPPEARVGIILLKYMLFGVMPMVIPSVLIDVPIPIMRIPRQQGTDLAYIKSLADDVGYTFYVDPGPRPGMSVAYWGPDIKVGEPQPALNYDMDAATNVESLSFTYNGDNKTMPIVFLQEPITKAPIPIPIPDITPLSPPLGAIPPFPKHFDIISETAKMSFPQAIMKGLAKAAKTAEAATVTGSLNVLRYGRVLKSRKLVGLRGVGPAFDGLYYVKSVTHNIKRGEYKQNFTLSRNGLVSTVSKVPA